MTVVHKLSPTGSTAFLLLCRINPSESISLKVPAHAGQKGALQLFAPSRYGLTLFVKGSSDISNNVIRATNGVFSWPFKQEP